MVGEILAAVVHRLNRSRGTPPEPGDPDYIAPGSPGYVEPPQEGDPGYVATVPHFVGEAFLNANDSPPRLVFVPTTDTFGAPTRIGTTPRALKSRAAGIECAVWGPEAPPATPDPLADFTGTEELVRKFVVALYQELRARFGETDQQVLELAGAEWLTPGQLTAFGMVCVVRFVLRVPVLVDSTGTAAAETLTITKSIQQ